MRAGNICERKNNNIYHCAGKRGWGKDERRSRSERSERSEQKKKKKVQLARVVIQDLHEYSKIAILRYLKTHLKVGVGTPKLYSNDL